MAQLVHPVSDIFVKTLSSGYGWEHSGGGLTFYTEVDEAVASDADWIQGDISAPNTTTSTCQLRLGAVADAGVNTGFKIRFRLNWNISYIDITPNAPDGDWAVNLYVTFSGLSVPFLPLTLGTISAQAIVTQPVTAGVWTDVEYVFTADDIATWRTFIGFGLPTSSVGNFAEPFVSFTLGLDSGFSQPDPTVGNLWATISWVEFEAPDSVVTPPPTPLIDDFTDSGTVGVKVGLAGGGDPDLEIFTGTNLLMTATGGLNIYAGSGGGSQFEVFVPDHGTVPNLGRQWRINAFTFKYRPEETS